MRLVLDLEVAGSFDRKEEKLINDLLLSRWGKSIPIYYEGIDLGNIKIHSYEAIVDKDIEEITMHGRVLGG